MLLVISFSRACPALAFASFSRNWYILNFIWRELSSLIRLAVWPLFVVDGLSPFLSRLTSSTVPLYRVLSSSNSVLVLRVFLGG